MEQKQHILYKKTKNGRKIAHSIQSKLEIGVYSTFYIKQNENGTKTAHSI